MLTQLHDFRRVGFPGYHNRGFCVLPGYYMDSGHARCAANKGLAVLLLAYLFSRRFELAPPAGYWTKVMTMGLVPFP